MMHAQAPSAQSVEAKQLSNMVEMGKLAESLQKGEISKPDYDKQVADLQAENARLQGLLAPSATGPATGTSAPSSPTTTGFGTQDTFESAPSARKPVELSPSSPTPPPYAAAGAGSTPEPIAATKEQLDGTGGGSKPSIAVGSN